MRVAVYIPPHTIVHYVYSHLVRILTALLYLYYTVSNKYIQSHRNRTVYMCTIARNRYCEFIMNFKVND